MHPLRPEPPEKHARDTKASQQFEHLLAHSQTLLDARNWVARQPKTATNKKQFWYPAQLRKTKEAILKIVNATKHIFTNPCENEDSTQERQTSQDRILGQIHMHKPDEAMSLRCKKNGDRKTTKVKLEKLSKRGLWHTPRALEKSSETGTCNNSFFAPEATAKDRSFRLGHETPVIFLRHLQPRTG